MTVVVPRLLFADECGELYDHPEYFMAVWDGHTVRPPQQDELLPLPRGSDLFALPDREAIGISVHSGGPEVVLGTRVAAAFVSPGYLRLALPAFRRLDHAVPLPLFAYAPVGFLRGRFYTTAVRVDRSRRQDPTQFHIEEIRGKVRRILRRFKGNRLFQHLARCALEYHCRAAQNLFLGREECPLPASPTCNARCLGCLSHQPEGPISASHERLTFVPIPEEIAEVALFHIERVKRPVVSFGQGCEGEPLMVADTIREAIKLIRSRTDRGTININTNGSDPEALARLCEVGLDAVRLTINSFDPHMFDSYTRPRGFDLETVLESGRVVSRNRGFVSVNYLLHPGVTDTEEELGLAVRGLGKCVAEMVQLRNLNIDPDIYMRQMWGSDSPPEGVKLLGLGEFIRRLRELTGVRYGYFNPPVRTLVRSRRTRKGATRPIALGERRGKDCLGLQERVQKQ